MARYNKLAGKHVLVIGGSQGIGRGVVDGAIEAQAVVTLVGSYRPNLPPTAPQSAQKAIAQIKALYPSSSVIGLSCDLATDNVEADLENIFVEAKKAHGQPVDHVVLTAGDPLVMLAPKDITLEKIRQVARMRLELPTILGKVAERHLEKSRECSVTISTGGIAEQPNPGWSVTAFMAAGLTGLARNLAVDLKPIRVNAVEPGPVDTGLWEAIGLTPAQKAEQMKMWDGKLPTGKVGDVVDVAEAYLYLMRDRNATGEIVKTRGGAHLI
ncbi:NAD(P)-binding protein [Annulohypoxylon maeteangense]|uniref:NAD(P)-binding protein n=1 Tax=Annulohypoxylon maeteangense TaxID=1927788 RepID=UPI002007B166|nr:NAD(P)-binding protein [Annulohypoxylon maeteangense]KAI0883889.1 NAD(P)-binding protein [Annulohypoxylon maeteangense]